MDVFDFANPAGGRPYRSLDSVSRITRRLLINTAAQFLIQSYFFYGCASKLVLGFVRASPRQIRFPKDDSNL